MQWPREKRFRICALLGSLTLSVAARASEAADADEQAAAVRAAAREYAAAVSRGDADAILQSWTKDGDYVDAAGRKQNAHELIRKMSSKPRGDAASRVPAVSESSLRFITPNVAIEDGAYDCGDAVDGIELAGHFTAIWVKRDGRWLLDSLRESAATATTLDEHLKPLDWLLGEWVSQTDDSTMIVSARVSDRGNYIIRDFAVLADGAEATATERIAWDPASGEIKSWTFDSQDGRGEGRWKSDGDRWLVETKQTMGDNQSATTSATLTRQGDQKFTWEVRNSKIGDQNVPPRRITFRRAPENR